MSKRKRTKNLMHMKKSPIFMRHKPVRLKRIDVKYVFNIIHS